MEITMMYKVALLLVMGLNLTACAITKFLQPTWIGTQPEHNADPESVSFQPTTVNNKFTDMPIITPQLPQQNLPPVPASAKLKLLTLLPEISPTEITDLSTGIFSAKIIDFLSPEIFSHPDPVRYFLDKSVDLSERDVRMVHGQLDIIFSFKLNKLPSRYLPYADVLENLLRCLSHLQGVRQAIFRMQRFADSTYPPLPAELFSPELFEFFSDYIFSDDRPPLQLIIKVINTPTLKDKISDFQYELKKAVVKRKVHVYYKTFLLEFRQFLMKGNIAELQASIFKLRDSVQIVSHRIDPESE